MKQQSRNNTLKEVSFSAVFACLLFLEVTRCSYVTSLQKKAVKETSFTVARDIKFQLVIRALPLEHWNEVKDIRENLVIPVGEKIRHRSC